MILQVKNVTKDFPVEKGFLKEASGFVRALDSIGFTVEEFQTLGIVGESGSGKTTLAKIIMKLIEPTSGEVIFNDNLINDFRKDVQIIFQNPFNSLDPRMRIIDIISEPLIIHRICSSKHLKNECLRLLETVGMDKNSITRLPNEFSGGQRQRICIARALASGPKFLILDEPVSSLDLTIQAQVLELFIELKERLKLTYIFISHNLAVIKKIADVVAVMKDGCIVERGPCQDIFSRPNNPYTKSLLNVSKV